MYAHSTAFLPDEPATILYIGVGSESRLRMLRARCKLTVVTPDDAELTSRSVYRLDRFFQMLHARVSGTTGLAELRVYQIPELSSFRRPTGVLKYYPGLQAQRTSYPTHIDVRAVRELHRLSASGCNLLVLNVGGDEDELVTAMNNDRYLSHFQNIIIYCGAEEWYAGAPEIGALRGKMKRFGFRLQFSYVDQWGRAALAFESSLSERIIAAQRETLRSFRGLLADQRAISSRQQEKISLLREELSCWRSQHLELARVIDGVSELHARVSRESSEIEELKSTARKVEAVKEASCRVSRERDEFAKESKFYADKAIARGEEVEVLQTQLELCQQRREELVAIQAVTDAEVSRLRSILNALHDSMKDGSLDSLGPHDDHS